MKKQFALVGIVPRKNLWTVIQKEKWYHVPVKVSPRNILKAEYAAFYFPEIFDEEKRNKIIYYAKVLNIDIVKRIQLFPKELTHERAQDYYYQLHLDQISELPRVIQSKRRIIHIMTNREKLFVATDINDLYDNSPIEDEIWKTMKQEKINACRQFFVDAGCKNYCLDFAIFCNNGKIDIECDGKKYHTLPYDLTRDRKRNNQLTSCGWHILRFIGKDIYRNMPYCLNIIKKTIDGLDGLIDGKKGKIG